MSTLYFGWDFVIGNFLSGLIFLKISVSICVTLNTGITHNGAQLGWQCSVREAAEVELQLPLVWLLHL